MAFDVDKAASLLDFDFSGGEVYFPKGYETNLDDAPGRPGQAFVEISEYHDVQDLLGIVLMFVPVARRYWSLFHDIVIVLTISWRAIRTMTTMKATTKTEMPLMKPMPEPHSTTLSLNSRITLTCLLT
jgi:hypothetical protein